MNPGQSMLVYLVSDVIDNLNLSAMDGGVRRRATRAAALRSADVDQAVVLRILRGPVQFAAHPAAIDRGHCLSGAGRRATRRTSAPSRISARSIWPRWKDCLSKC